LAEEKPKEGQVETDLDVITKADILSIPRTKEVVIRIATERGIKKGKVKIRSISGVKLGKIYREAKGNDEKLNCLFVKAGLVEPQLELSEIEELPFMTLFELVREIASFSGLPTRRRREGGPEVPTMPSEEETVPF